MYYGTIKSCTVSHTDATIVLPYIDSIHTRNYILNGKSLHSGIDIICRKIYTPCNCVILSTAKVEETYSIILQYSVDICLRFTNLKSVNVAPGNLILAESEIATSNSYVHVEYLTTSINSIQPWTIRIGPLQLYKHDPLPILDGSFVFDNTIQLENEYDDQYFTQSYPPGYVEGPY